MAKRTSRAAKKKSPSKSRTRKSVKRAAATRRSRGRRSTAKRAAGARKASGRRRATGAKSARAAKTTTTRKKAAPRKKPSTASTVATTVRGAVAGAVAAVTNRKPGDTDALAMLERDHRRVQALLKQGEDTTAQAVQRRTELLETITRELTIHEALEEKILYPALKAHPEGKDLALEGYQEHHVADVLLKELHEVAKDDERWGAKFKVLQENLDHHIEEEEGPMFRTARGLFSREELQAIGAEMQKLKAQLEGARTV